MKCVIFILCALIVSPLSAFDIPREVRVRILSIDHPREIAVGSPDGKIFSSGGVFPCTKATLSLDSGRKLHLLTGQDSPEDLVSYSSASGITLSFRDLKKSYVRKYSGRIEISVEADELLCVNIVPFEEYVHSAALSELGNLATGGYSFQKKELVSAMEICIRSFLAREGSRHSGSYQFCDLTHCVHYVGEVDNRESLTKGILLVDADNKVVSALFSSTCGGSLAGPDSYWENAPRDAICRKGSDSLEKTDEPLCAKSPHAHWKVFIKDPTMYSLTFANVEEIRAERKDGRVVRLRCFDENGKEKVVPIAKFISDAGRMLGWNVVKSNLFIIQKSSRGWILEGQGLGHGTGLCQYGAEELARRGFGYEKILAFYYPGARLVKGSE